MIIIYNNNSNILSVIGEIDRFNGKGPTLSQECSHHRVIKGFL